MLIKESPLHQLQLIQYSTSSFSISISIFFSISFFIYFYFLSYFVFCFLSYFVFCFLFNFIFSSFPTAISIYFLLTFLFPFLFPFLFLFCSFPAPFSISFFPSGNMKHLSDSCLVVDSLGAAARRELLEEFVQLQLLPYERLFGPDRPHFALDQVRSTGFMICPLPLFFNGVSCLEITLLVSNSHFQLSTLCQCLSLSSSLPRSLPLLYQLFLYLCLTFFTLCLSLSLSLSSF